MSWGIKLFAEKRRKGSDKWEMIGKTNIMSEVKDFCLLTRWTMPRVLKILKKIHSTR